MEFGLTIISAIIIFGVLIFVHELGHFATAKWFGVKVHEFSIGMGPAVFKKKKGETDYSVRILPIGGFVRLEGEDFASEDERAFNKCHPLKRIIILASGAFMNVLTGFLLFVILFSFSGNVAVPYVDSVIEGSTAWEAGIEPGDRIIKVNDTRVHIQSDITLEMFLHGDKEVKITVARNGENQEYSVLPKTEDGRHVIGFYHQIRKLDIKGVLYQAWYNTFFTVKLVYTSLKMLITGKVGIGEMSGPVGIVGEIGNAAKQGILYLIDFAALIAVNLGIMNLLPFPALDGGRIVFVILEMIRRKPIKENIEGYFHLVGIIILFLVMIFITFSDITKLIR